MAAAVSLGGVACAPREDTSLLIVTLDTTRRDHLTTYGYERDTAPKLDRVARAGVVFENAFSQDVETAPSHASMFTGLYPHAHGSTSNGVAVRDDVPTLAEILSSAGFATGAVIAASPLRAEMSGLQRGFTDYDDALERNRRLGDEIVERAVAWLRAHRGQRTFLFVHFYDVHGAYRAQEPYASLFRPEGPGRVVADIPKYQKLGSAENGWDLAPFIARYDGMIRFVDDRLAELLEHVDLEHTIVVILADHGESLDERAHVLDHGGQLFDEQVRIPLILHGPGLAPARVQGVAQTIDLMPTLLALLDVPVPGGSSIQGRDLVPMIRGETPEYDRPAYASARPRPGRLPDRGYRLDLRKQLDSIRYDGWKLIRYPGARRSWLELYDLEADPGERVNVAQANPTRVRALAERLDRWAGEAAPLGVVPTLSPDARRELEALGYGE